MVKIKIIVYNCPHLANSVFSEIQTVFLNRLWQRYHRNWYKLQIRTLLLPDTTCWQIRISTLLSMNTVSTKMENLKSITKLGVKFPTLQTFLFLIVQHASSQDLWKCDLYPKTDLNRVYVDLFIELPLEADVKNSFTGAGKMFQQLRILAVLQGDQGLILITHMEAQDCLFLQFHEIQDLLVDSMGIVCLWCTCRQVTHTRKVEIKENTF